MSRWVKQNSSNHTVQLGPFLLSSDGVTPSTAQAPTIYVSKAGGAFSTVTSTSTGTPDVHGWYRFTPSSGDVATLGSMILQVTNSTHLPVWHEFEVVPANVYSSLFAGTDNLEVDVVAWVGTTASTSMTAPTTAPANFSLLTISTGGSANADVKAWAAVTATTSMTAPTTAPSNFSLLSISTAGRASANMTQLDGSSAAADLHQRMLDALENGTVAAASSGSFTLQTGASTVDDYYNGQEAWILSNTGVEQVRQITDYVGATLVATIEPFWATTPTTSATYVLLPVGAASTGTVPSVNVIKWQGNAVSTAAIGPSTAIAKTTNVTGFNDLSSTAVTTAVDASTVLTSRASSTSIPTNLQYLTVSSSGGYADSRPIMWSSNSAPTSTSDIAIKSSLAKTTHITGFNDVSTGSLDGVQATVTKWSTALHAVTTGDIAIKTTLAKTTHITGFNDISTGVLNDLSAAQVNAQVLDVVNTDTFAELSSAPPSSAPTLRQMMQWGYQIARNKIVTDASTMEVYDSTGGAVAKATISEASSVLTRAQFTS